jgi:hypothetical protein
MATKGTFLGPQGHCIFKCIINLVMLFGFKKQIWLWYFEMVAELALGVWKVVNLSIQCVAMEITFATSMHKW